MIGLFAFLAAASSSPQCLAIDGDTIVCRVGLQRVHLRLNGIDAPELPGHCRKGRHCAPGDPFASKANMAAMVAGKTVSWQDLGTDRYGRTIAEVTVHGTDVQCAQLRGGFAIYKYRWDNHKVLKHVCGLTATK
jgi:micrococcal nuclease